MKYRESLFYSALDTSVVVPYRPVFLLGEITTSFSPPYLNITNYGANSCFRPCSNQEPAPRAAGPYARRELRRSGPAIVPQACTPTLKSFRICLSEARCFNELLWRS